MDFLAELNPKQREAVEAPPGPVLVLAGPGSGKTRVLTYRLGYLVRAQGVAPWQLMAVTFTNKAAREMKERLAPGDPAPTRSGLLSPRQLQGLTIGTFHAVCARILRREVAALPGWDANFVIYDTDDQLALVRQALRDLDLDEKRYAPSTMLHIISNAKNELVGAHHFQARTYVEEIAGRVYQRYQELLQANNAFDFDDLLMKTVDMFGEHPDLLAAYQERYQHLLVDEFQDTNMAQYELLKRLGGGHHHLYVVADEDQSIYSWRGADYRNVLRFRDDFPDHHLVLLEQNYRSTAHILEAAKHVIRQNAHRVDKDLFTQRGDGLKVRLIETYDEHEEAQFVVDEIGRIEAEGQLPAGQCAIMYRTNAQSRALEEEFIRRGKPYRLVRGTRFYERREIKDVIAYLRVVHNPQDSISLGRIINAPPRGIGDKTLQALQAWAFKLEKSAYEALRQLSSQAGDSRQPLPAPFAGRSRTALLAFAGLIAGLVAARERLTLPELFDLTLARSGYRDMVKDGTPEGEEHWENLMELRRVTQEYAALDPAEALPMFLEQVALVSDVDGLTQSGGGPALLTLHAAKGLEFPAVFMVGMDEGLLPHSRSLDDADAMEEERRLCYVGITRAMDALYLMHTFRRATFGQNNLSVPSRFLADIPEGLLEQWPPRAAARRGEPAAPLRGTRAEGTARPPGSISGGRPAGRWDPRNLPFTPRHSRPAGSNCTPADDSPRPDQLRFRAGDVVVHARFGEGIVVRSELTKDDLELEVAFPGLGVKKLSVNFAPLRKKGDAA
jgi:DNA helicase-2/ATP-dependent DNA helicase PcrA